MSHPPQLAEPSRHLPARHLTLVWSQSRVADRPCAARPRTARHLRLVPAPRAEPAATPAAQRRTTALVRIAFVVACVLVLAAVCRAAALETQRSPAEATAPALHAP